MTNGEYAGLHTKTFRPPTLTTRKSHAAVIVAAPLDCYLIPLRPPP